MKLVRYGKSGQEKPGMIDGDGKLRDLSAHIDDISSSTMSQISKLKKLKASDLPLVKGKQRFGPCVGDIGKLMCIGLNYSDHAAETGSKLPEHPMLFMKANSAIVGANDNVVLPRKSKTTDWEVELAVVIGLKAKYVSEADALKYIAGYCICNDVSERTFQKQMSGQFTKGKSCDTFGPLGPWLVTRDEVKDPQNLSLTMDLNGKRMQDGHTSDMIFTAAQIISHLSQMFTLYPGDVISTGTPSGVGAGIKPKPKFLKVGDVMQLSIEGLGQQTQNVKMDK
jgi:2-keto-4-pentenoate hydratase/2-oxohepta-3-ene-1,7-dioic acid hydratase in catechol pathway